MSELTRVVTAVAKDRFVFFDPNSSELSGIALELWRRTARDLNLTYALDVRNWTELIAGLEENRCDVIAQRLDGVAISAVDHDG